MSKFIKVTEQGCGEVKLIPVSSAKEILEDKHGSIVFHDDGRFFAKESLEQIEAQLLRDEFAKAALTGFTSKDGTTNPELDSHICYQVADAMLKERSK
ncbi:hypothetical protein MMG00_12030 [Ignatzschineria rhizosphaerae]|uniref:Uncharacterized protein n=1 Tax=Ignatzschineria rhizosphaerae TaxID=2923279 RepID=A0ABY3X7D0_9GAMM|nr:hypothetical protein [Ignatzschineria rhizosphaerae]UNM95913.1 hypothetical protein MMG00_12030 [Ignatzschineria rhizosphaerae]